jgi:hypothetical protein
MRSCKSAGTAAATAGTTTGSGFIAPAGGFHGTLGDGDAPAAPLTRGGLPQLAMTRIKGREIPWRTLVEGGIIPNTPFAAVLLAFSKGYVQGRVALHLAIRIDLQEL